MGNKKRTILHKATQKGFVRLVACILNIISKQLSSDAVKIFVNEPDALGWTSLHFACHIMNKELVELLIQFGAKIDADSRAEATVFECLRTSYQSMLKLYQEVNVKFSHP